MAPKCWLAAALKAANASVSRSNYWQSLRQRADFLFLQQHGQKWVTPAFVLLAQPSESAALPQVGFTVTKKIGGAVIRNRIRRRLRAVIDQVAADKALPAWKISLTARHEALDKDFTELVRDTKWALRKLQEKSAEKPMVAHE